MANEVTYVSDLIVPEVMADMISAKIEAKLIVSKIAKVDTTLQGTAGKKKAWQSYSAICLLSFSLFLFCGSGDTYLLTILAALVSIPASGAYLNDVFLTDTIDYDEFLTGKRNEGVYMVFSVFIPKIVGIAAQSIPLTIMSLMGFVSSNGGVVYEQPKGVLEFIRFVSFSYLIIYSI